MQFFQRSVENLLNGVIAPTAGQGAMQGAIIGNYLSAIRTLMCEGMCNAESQLLLMTVPALLGAILGYANQYARAPLQNRPNL